MARTSYIPLKVIRIRKDTADTKSFVLKEFNGRPVHYRPGQFLTLVFRGKNREERRYSTSSTPALDEPLTITVKRIDNGEFSRQLFDAANVEIIGKVMATVS